MTLKFDKLSEQRDTASYVCSLSVYSRGNSNQHNGVKLRTPPRIAVYDGGETVEL